MNHDSPDSRSEAEHGDVVDNFHPSDAAEGYESRDNEGLEYRKMEHLEPSPHPGASHDKPSVDCRDVELEDSLKLFSQAASSFDHFTDQVGVSKDNPDRFAPNEFPAAEGSESAISGLIRTKDHPKLHRSDDGVSSDLPVKHDLGPGSVEQAEASSRQSDKQDPLRQSLFLLATLALMLVAVRYFVPQVVEEIRYSWHRGELRAEYESGSEGLRNVSLDTLSRAYQMVTSAVGPSVVHIDVKQASSVSDLSIQVRVIPPYTPRTDQGSGVIVSKDGFLLTNRHVVVDSSEIHVTLGDGRRLKADVVGTDKQTDLAVLKVEAEGLIPIVWGDSDRCRVGTPVWAVGSPFGLDQTVTFGILSGKHRLVEDSTHYQDFMQSDVAVNPGNSGGPLVDARGALVGINTAIVGESYQGVSFAVPSNVARQVYERIRKIGRVDRGWLGVRLSEAREDELVGDDRRMRGAVISGLTNESSPAAVAGLKLGDHILSVDDKNVRDLPHLMRLIGASLAGSDINLKVVRNGVPLTVKVVLGARPEMLNQP